MHSAAPPEDPRLADHGYAAQSCLMDTQSLTGIAGDLPSLRGISFTFIMVQVNYVASKNSTKTSALWSPVVIQRGQDTHHTKAVQWRSKMGALWENIQVGKIQT